MDPALWTRIETFFGQALDRPAEERTAWLRHACGDDPVLYREVVSLLDADAAPAELLGGLAFEAFDPGDVDRLLATVPETVGPWRVGDVLGVGGMGTVYRAERREGFAQTVALKLVKRGMDTDAVLARFRSERQILASLEHPGIARLVDGGLADDGRPYLAMEYVEGEPITDYCDRHGLGISARLGLVAEVGEAVAFAHQNLVVHRDLKPSNVLVTPEGRVKLLDFGIAKVLADDADALHTRTGQRAFTPSYAAPEQLRGGRITTAADVYGLGAVLYRLLTGIRPVPTEGRSPAEVELAILADDPAPPSTVVRRSEEVAAARGTTPGRLQKRLRGDLDQIVLRALRRDPADRYETVRDLLDDLRRHREGLPVAARAGTRGYRLRRFAGRHRGALAGTAAALAVIVGVSAVAFARVAAERDRAETEAETAREVAGFLGSVLEEANPARALGDTISVYAALDSAALRLRTDLADQPAVQARLLTTIGDIYLGLNNPEAAEAALGEAVRLARSLRPPDPAIEIAALTTLGATRDVYRRLDDALPLLLEAAALARDHLDPSDPLYARAIERLAEVHRNRTEYALAEPLYDELLTLQRRYRAGTPELATTTNNHALFVAESGDHARALALHRETLALRIELLGAFHPSVANSLANLAHVSEASGAYADAVRWGWRADSLNQAIHGPEHQRTLRNRRTIAEALVGLGDVDRAEPLIQEVLDATEGSGSGNTNRARTLVIQSQALQARGLWAEAEASAIEGGRIYAAAAGPESFGVARALATQGQAALGRGDTARGRALLNQARDLYLAGVSADHFHVRALDTLLGQTEGR
ncbi:hypothetical protein B1759_15460 [Rubrivirga sp. SAORIC476]|uniref:serine/threonine-protein kinase n=1 Tax=Rubrivirga sp. SAORIC476 TaxID=1961794 RepID=UPI000BA8D25C|nr:serine/threonine-protein kinase [Rubrivirga sp. SAORIC476]PAP79709.1 hypothetical protein B1759_15460 [Rubrivirga sp. SAORIC476]